MAALVVPWFDVNANRRAFWPGMFAYPKFMAFAAKIRPLMREPNKKLCCLRLGGNCPESVPEGAPRRSPRLGFIGSAIPHL